MTTADSAAVLSEPAGASSRPRIAAPAVPSAAAVTLALAKREVVRFARQRSRWMGALLTPLVFWLLLGFGLDRAVTFAPTDTGAAETAPGVGYLEYFLPGSLLLVVLFSSIFSTMTLIEDRRDGFLSAILASPAPRGAVVLGRVLGGAVVAWAQAGLFLLLAPVFGVNVSASGMLLAWLAAGVASLGLTAVGVWVAWPMTSTSAYHAVMNLVLMPAWLLSGAVFPPSSAAGPIQAAMYANPLTYAQAWLSGILQGPASAAGVGLPMWACGLAAGGAAGLALVGAARVATRPAR
ncbi:MAG: ABC transporter permease [Planctomycetota bacterium]